MHLPEFNINYAFSHLNASTTRLLLICQHVALRLHPSPAVPCCVRLPPVSWLYQPTILPRRAFVVTCSAAWNTLPSELHRSEIGLRVFNEQLKTVIIIKYLHAFQNGPKSMASSTNNSYY
jgi:hypothetical protein